LRWKEIRNKETLRALASTLGMIEKGVCFLPPKVSALTSWLEP